MSLKSITKVVKCHFRLQCRQRSTICFQWIQIPTGCCLASGAQRYLV